jgi:hypothetical protein
MLKMCVGMLLLLCVSQAHAQNWSEWFRQKKTQIKYLTQQIAALQIYIELGQQGYGIARDGLRLIDDIKHGDFDLHNGYFTSLTAVKPNIGHSSKVVALYGLQEKIAQQIAFGKKLVSNNHYLSGEEKVYCLNVFGLLSRKTDENKLALHLLISRGHYQLTDDERLKRIVEVYDEAQRQYAFSKQFMGNVSLLLYSKQKEMMEAKRLQRVYEKSIP